jgi:hypothetical protein
VSESGCGAIGFDAPGANRACHVPTIIDWEHAGTFGAGWANAADSPTKVDATDAAVRFNVPLQG